MLLHTMTAVGAASFLMSSFSARTSDESFVRMHLPPPAQCAHVTAINRQCATASNMLKCVHRKGTTSSCCAGVSNKYLELTKDPKYQQHPTSTNEKNHIAVFFLDLLQKAENNFLKTLAPEHAQHVSSTVIEAVEFTDMMVSW